MIPSPATVYQSSFLTSAGWNDTSASLYHHNKLRESPSKVAAKNYSKAVYDHSSIGNSHEVYNINYLVLFLKINDENTKNIGFTPTILVAALMRFYLTQVAGTHCLKNSPLGREGGMRNMSIAL